MMMFILWLFTILLLVAIVLISLAYCAAIFHRHRDHRDRDKGLYEKGKVKKGKTKKDEAKNDETKNDEMKKTETLPPELKNIYISLVERRYSTIQNYFIYQIVNKVFGFTGVIYSIFGLGLGLIDPPSEMDAFSMKALCATVSFISIVCVIIALYLSPTRRVEEYIKVWRLYDRKVSEMLGVLPSYSKIENVDTQAATPGSGAPESDAGVHKAEVSELINELSKFVFEIESSITSECE